MTLNPLLVFLASLRRFIPAGPLAVLLGFIAATGLTVPASAAPISIPLMAQGSNKLAWIFDNGQEFPGATGEVLIDAAQKYDGYDSLKLVGNFTKGGAYVRTGAQLNGTDIRDLTMWLRSPDTDHITLRIIDSTGQCHQISFKVLRQTEWQRFDFPLQKFFAKTEDTGGTPVSKYESWGGAADQNWHGPAKAMDVIIGPTDTLKVVNLWLNDVTIIPPAVSLTAGVASTVETSARIDELVDGAPDWIFENGGDVPGAKGSLKVVNDGPATGESSLQLSGDFTGGGAYVQALKTDLSSLTGDLKQIRLKVKSQNVTAFSVRLIDSTGQCHQHKGIPVAADGRWHDMTLKTSDLVGGEHWGGANDGQWHGPAKAVAILLGKDSSGKDLTPSIMLADMTADVITAAMVGAPTFTSGFEGSGKLPAGWSTQGDVTIDTTQAFKGTNSLLLHRTPIDVNKPASVVSPSFKMTPGLWKLSLACRSALQSPDASFDAVVTLQFLAGNTVLDHVTLADVFGQSNWQPITKQVQAPAGTDSARIRVELNKTSGNFWIDEISAAFLSPVLPKDDRIVKLYFDTAQVGNLLYPTDARTIKATVETSKPLDPSQLTLTYNVRDYWGAEQTSPGTVALSRIPGKVNNHFAYTGSLDLSGAPLEIGRYYELDGEILRSGDEPYRNHTAIAILPEAPANSFKPLEIPFSSRDWDDRITEYFTLSHRLGIRLCNIWSGWDADHPDQPYAPGIDICAKLGMGVIAGTPLNAIETHRDGYQKLTEPVLREGTRNLITKYSKVAQPFIISLGNEPPTNAEWIPEDIKAYSYVYDEAKKTDPNIMVLGTSVGPVESFLQAGLGKYSDAYDFHIYEDAHNVALSLQKYRDLFQKYGNPKPVWSTELGLNSQGVSRHAVAVDMVKKFALFFASGGANMSWFDLLYPDPEGKNLGGSGEAHDVFDSRYSKYFPKLTAVMYYDLINTILDKKFVAAKDYGDTHLYLFRNAANHSLIMELKDKGRQNISLPLPGVNRVDVIRVDTRRRTLDAGGKAVTLTVGEDPMLITFDGKISLPDALGAPEALFSSAPEGLVRGAANDLSLSLDGIPPDAVTLTAPPFWGVKKSDAANGKIHFTVTSPENTSIREADLIATIKGANGLPRGELYLRPSVTGQLSSQVIPVPASGDKPAAVKFVVKNNGTKSQEVTWEMSLKGEMGLVDGTYPETPSSARAYFADTPSGSMTLAGGQTSAVVVPLTGVDSQNVYQVAATVTDAAGRTSNRSRNVAGFVAVPKVRGTMKLDGVLDDADWRNAPIEKIDQARQYFTFDKTHAQWKGPADLSGTIRFLWDDKNLYVGVEVTDDIAGGLKQDDMLWAMDGLQFLVDPCRGLDESVGKYDYAMAVGAKGPQAWCSLTADAGAPNGEAKDITVAYKRKGDGTGSITYELAIPWSRLAPFKPGIGADLGLTMILNEDDGKGRHSFMTWFGNAHSKQIDTVGDLMLGP